MPFYYKDKIIFGGSPGSGVPDGGTANQVLAKVTDEDGDVEWRDGGITQETADERYLKLTGGTLSGNLKLEDGTREVDLDVINGTYTFVQDGVSTIIGESSNFERGNIIGGLRHQ